MLSVTNQVVVPSCARLSTKFVLTPAVSGYAVCNRRSFHRTQVATERHSETDVIIVGGGLVGTAMACALGCSKILSEKKIVLLEGAPSKPYEMKPTFSNRVSAVSPSSVGLFKDVGVWDKILSHRVKVVKKMQVWDALSNASISFSREKMEDPVVHIVENDLLLWTLSERIKDFPNVTVMYNSKIKDIELPKRNGKPQVILEDGASISGDLLIGADGINSKVRSSMKTRFRQHIYDQLGVVATLTLEEPHENVVAWQRFLSTGPIALLPLSEDSSSLVWSTTPVHAKHLLSISNEEFVNAVNEAFITQDTVDNFSKSVTEKFNSLLEMMKLMPNDIVQLPPKVKYLVHGSRAVFPLGTGGSTRYVNKCVALVGDAAHRVHPLAGQGVNLGFGDVHTLAHLVEAAVYRGEHIGYGKHLLVYESIRTVENGGKVSGINMIHSIYNTTFTPFVALRSIGLSIVHASTSFKKKLMESAST